MIIFFRGTLFLLEFKKIGLLGNKSVRFPQFTLFPIKSHVRRIPSVPHISNADKSRIFSQFSMNFCLIFFQFEGNSTICSQFPIQPFFCRNFFPSIQFVASAVLKMRTQYSSQFAHEQIFNFSI